MEQDDPSLLAARIAARCATQVNRLTRQIVAEQEAVVPGLATLPDAIKELEIASTTRHGLRLFLRMARGEAVTDADMRLFRERAAQRVGDGVPLAYLLSGYMVAHRALWRALCAATRPGEDAGLHRLGELILTALERATTAASEAYLSEVMLAERGEALRAVARTLLSGRPAGDVAARHGVVLEPGYHVLAFALGDPSPGPGGRRRVRAIQATLDRLADEPVLSSLDTDGGHALLPLRIAVPASRLSRRLVDAVAPVHTGMAVAGDIAEIPGAARRASRIAEVARAGGRPSGVYGLRDVLLDYHLGAPGDSGTELAGLLDVLEPSLVGTLDAYFAADFDRRATARALGVHPNTVDNRLARVSTLIGADPRTSRGVMLIGAALTARRLNTAALADP
ncbi:helix-turn-helix domain-containing protein [Microtetraspora sp. AC03309]|uniref:PucR family transcriptional regulator n=1 Tax=Microtetraspora sp. AC03309 TaxID=2779376 RepID=UPI001E4624CD|nr:helix-turn-helix domain-containing protein [Microtetraspora sp. AC03309]MCC5574160.1 helix-turn-helix domain-containing protein [Microtetraspora sp. AC03309]